MNKFVECEGLIGALHGKWVLFQEAWPRWDGDPRTLLDELHWESPKAPVDDLLLPVECGIRPPNARKFAPVWVHRSDLPSPYKHIDVTRPKPTAQELVACHFSTLLEFQRSTVKRIIPKDHMYYGFTEGDHYIGNMSRKAIIIEYPKRPYFVRDTDSSVPEEGDVVYCRVKNGKPEWFSCPPDLDAFLRFLHGEEEKYPEAAFDFFFYLMDKETQEMLFLRYSRQ
jgi:hypothetical protein